MVLTPVSSLGLCNSLYIRVDPFLDLKWILDERRLTMQFPFYAFAQPYLHFPSMSTAQSLVHLIWWRICLPQITIHIKWHIKQGWEKKGAPADESKKGGKNTGGTEQGAKASRWKSFTCHEASGSWSLHSTMSCIQLCMHSVRVTRRCWKNICCYVSGILGIKKRWCIQIYAIQAMFPRALCPSGEQLLSFTASSPLSASSN